MFAKTLKQFRALTPPVRALVFLLWIHTFASFLVGVFTQIFLYQKFTSVTLNIFAAFVLYAGCMVGFCIPGYLAGVWRLNIKPGFITSFTIIALSILYLPHIVTIQDAYVTMFFWGVGQGLFWLTANTYELIETKDHERDFYSSVLNAGYQLLSLLGPATATLLIYLSGSFFHLGTYTLLFTLAPAVYLLGLFFFSRINNYHPKPITWADVKHYYVDRQNQAAQLYTVGAGFQHIVWSIIPPLVIFYILGTTLNVGLYNTFFAIFSAICLLVVAQYRTKANRIKIYGITSTILVLALIQYGYVLTFAALVIYTVVDGIITPLFNVSDHVAALAVMEVGRKESDFYASMVFRDFSLWIWRSVACGILLLLIHYFGEGRAILSAGLYLLAAGFAISYIGAYWFTKLSHIVLE